MKIIEVYFAAKSVLLTQRQYWKDFGRNNVPYGRTIQRLVAIFQKDRKCGRCQQRLTSFIIWHNSWEYSWFRGTPWGRNWHFENIRNILWRYQSKDWNDPGLVDLNELNNVNHCGLCRASATLPVSGNLATKHWIVLLSGTYIVSAKIYPALPVSEELILRQNMPRWFLLTAA